ncbi:MAG: hypothetical protein IJH57_02030 [Mogibacterium sp.]|nr:hypothetical protein [Mogibacterium sp.]
MKRLGTAKTREAKATAKILLKKKIVCIVLLMSFAVSTDMFAFTMGYAADQEPAVKKTESQDAGYEINFNDKEIRRLKNRSIKGKNYGINLRTLLKEKREGYSVVQGGCTDGKYVYYLMVSSSNQKGRILKLRLKDRKVVKRGPVVDVHHGNGMAYDKKRNRLVVIGRKARRCEVVTINAKTLKLISKVKTNYSAAGKWKVKNSDGYYGLAAIAYIPRYDCFLALQRKTHDILILDPKFKVIGFVKTKIGAKYPGTFQAMDADEKYVYLLLSAYQDNPKKQPNNLIVALDWNSENLLPYVNKDMKKYSGKWNCNNNKNGSPDAVIRIKTPNEAENIYHTVDSKGRRHFYMSEHCPYPKYVYVNKRVKERVKWKRVKVKGKYVWKYKNKYVTKKVRKRIRQTYRRDSYVYNLGII